LSVLPLDPGHSGLLDGLAEYMGACAAVCLEKNAHSPGVLMPIEGDYSSSFSLTWSTLSEKHHSTCADIQEATA
jgi:hypothetical protein